MGSLARWIEQPKGRAAMAELIVVDDEPDLRLMLAESLGAAGHEVRCAADGLELRRLLTDAPADLVVLDVGLPGEDRIRRRPMAARAS